MSYSKTQLWVCLNNEDKFYIPDPLNCRIVMCKVNLVMNESSPHNGYKAKTLKGFLESRNDIKPVIPKQFIDNNKDFSNEM